MERDLAVTNVLLNKTNSPRTDTFVRIVNTALLVIKHREGVTEIKRIRSKPSSKAQVKNSLGVYNLVR